MEALVGNTLIDAKGKSFSLSDVIKPGTKAVGLYFSAHWCPPCRAFTPVLAKAYSQHLKNKGLEIIFVSSDKDEKAFKQYLGEMPWYAVPFADRDRKNKLSSKYKIQGIPSFVILEPNGELITTEGRRAVSSDLEGKDMPWRPRSVLELLNSGSYIGSDPSVKKTFSELSKDCEAVGLYFSASWCGPCHKFTPILSACYQSMAKADADAKRPKRFEVIYLPSDRDEASFKKYFGEMPWHALPLEDSLKETLEERYNIEGIPSLIIIDPKTGKSINEEAVPAVAVDVEGTEFPWAPKSVEMLDMATAGKIGPTPTLFVFCGSNEKAKEIQNDLMTAVDVWRGNAEEGAVCHGDVCVPTGGKLQGTEDMLFFVAGANPVVERVKELAKADSVTVAILDLGRPSYAHADIPSIEKVTPLALRKFVQGYLAGTVTKTTIAT